MVQFNERATSSRFWLMIFALIIGVYAVVKIGEMGHVGDPRHPLPVPSGTITSGPTPSPLCQDAADAKCWETEDEVGPPWFWRERGRVR